MFPNFPSNYIMHELIKCSKSKGNLTRLHKISQDLENQNSDLVTVGNLLQRRNYQAFIRDDQVPSTKYLAFYLHNFIKITLLSLDHYFVVVSPFIICISSVVVLVRFYRVKNQFFSFVLLKRCNHRCEASPPVKKEIAYGNYKPTIKDKDGKDMVIPYEKFDENHKKMISKNDEAKIVLYNALPKKEYERIFMCNTAQNIWDYLITTHQGNKQVKDNKIDLFVQKYEEFSITDDETIDCAFSRFNPIITSLKALDESFSSRNHVRKFLRALPSKWRPKLTAIEESKDLSKLSLDELVGNLKVYEVVLEKDLESAKNKKEKYKSLALKARQVLSDEDASSSDSNDEEYAMAVRHFKKFFRIRGKFVRHPYDDKKNFRKAKEDKKEDRTCFKCGDPNHFISDCPKNSFNDQKAFVVGCWSDSGDDKEEICLMAYENEVLSDTPYYSSSSLDNESRQNEYDKLCKVSLGIINKNKHLKAKNKLFKRNANELKIKLELFEKNK
ncbi:zf-CCHC domain-containing protein [Tanacetum coccineum]